MDSLWGKHFFHSKILTSTVRAYSRCVVGNVFFYSSVLLFAFTRKNRPVLSSLQYMPNTTIVICSVRRPLLYSASSKRFRQPERSCLLRRGQCPCPKISLWQPYAQCSLCMIFPACSKMVEHLGDIYIHYET